MRKSVELKFSLSVTLVILLFTCPLVSFASAQEETASFNVTYAVGYGGLLWVNGSSIVNASVVGYENNTALVLAATPTNANYSYSSMNLNGTEVTDNPAFYSLVTNETSVYNLTVSVAFVAETIPTPTPTPDPEALTVDDAVGLGVVALMFAVGLPVAFLAVKRKESS